MARRTLNLKPLAELPLNNTMEHLPRGVAFAFNKAFGSLSIRELYVFFRAIAGMTENMTANNDFMAWKIFPDFPDREQWYNADNYDGDEHPYDEFRLDLYNVIARATDHHCKDLETISAHEILRNFDRPDFESQGPDRCKALHIPHEATKGFYYLMGDRSCFMMFNDIWDLERYLHDLHKHADELVDQFCDANNHLGPITADELNYFKDVAKELWRILPIKARKHVNYLCASQLKWYLTTCWNKEIKYCED